MGYVLVTGASAGIGMEFARRLAEESYSLVLVARRKERLEQLARELSERHGVDVLVQACDLNEAGAAAQIEDFVRGRELELTGLINNAGFGERGHFAALSREHQLDMVQVNVTALTDLSWRMIPLLRGRKGGFIINVASTAAFQAGPNMAVYYASKAYVLSLSEALHEELRKEGIAVSALCPGATHSEFAGKADMTDTLLFKAGAMSAQKVVRVALRRRNNAIVVPGLKNLLGTWIAKFFPRLLTRRAAAILQS